MTPLLGGWFPVPFNGGTTDEKFNVTERKVQICSHPLFFLFFLSHSHLTVFYNMFSTGVERVLRFFGKTDDDILRASLRWRNLLIRLLPERYYRRCWRYINWYNNKLRTTNTIIQRIRQLEQEGGEEIYIYNLHPDIPLAATSPDEDRRRQDNITLRIRLLNIYVEMLRVSLGRETYWDRQPDKTATWKYWEYWKEYYDYYGRSNPCIQTRQNCADRGGCCARACGCCDKVLGEYWGRTYGGLERSTFLQKAYAHCTSDCACCVMKHGVYVPDPRLPIPGFVAG